MTYFVYMNTFKKIFYLCCAFVCIDARISAFAEELPPSPSSKKKEVDVRGFRNYLDGMEEAELDLEGFLSLHKNSKVVILDVRSQLGFDQKHIKDSINIPLTELTEHTLEKNIPDKMVHVVLVCDASFVGHMSRMIPMTIQAWPVLKASGYENVHTLDVSNLSPEQKAEFLVR